MDKIIEHAVEFDSTNYKQVPSDLITCLILGISVAIGASIFLYMELRSGSLNWSNDVVPFIKSVVFPSIILIPVLYRLFYYQKIHTKFTADKSGIHIGNILIPWNSLKSFNMLGESRFWYVLPSRYQTDPFIGENEYVLNLETKMYMTKKRVCLRVVPGRTAEFEKILAEHNIKRRTKADLAVFG
jgi:hypothetical protein